jgi:hypothetical protein
MEPTLSQIDDYSGTESQEKRKTIHIVISLLLALGLGYSMVKSAVDTQTSNEIIPFQYNR